MKLAIVDKIRTNNFTDEHVMRKLTDMWKSVQPTLSTYDYVYGLYYEYESDYKGDYTLAIAVKSKEENESSISIIPDTKYEVFEVNTDDEQGIFNTWNDIWKKEEEGLLKRAYTFDFEKYYSDGKIEIYIAVV